MCTAAYGHADCARLLIDAGADKDAKGEVRRRSLHCGDAFLYCFSCAYFLFCVILLLHFPIFHSLSMTIPVNI